MNGKANRLAVQDRKPNPNRGGASWVKPVLLNPKQVDHILS